MEVAKKNRQLQETLARYEEFNTMFNTSGELHCILDQYGKIEMINNSVTKILGYQVQEAVGRNMWHFCLKEDRERTIQHITGKIMQGDRQFELETRIRTKDGSIRWISWAASTKKRKWFTNGRDVTNQKNLLSEMEQLSVVASKVNNGVVISNADNEVIWVNDAFARITGYTIADLSGKKLGDILKGEGTDENTIAKAREFTRNKQSFSVELLVYRKDGQPIWLSVMNSMVLNDAGEIDKEVEIITDITERKKDEERLETLSLAAAKSASGVFIRKAHGEIIWVNDAFEKITGYSYEELKGHTFAERLIGKKSNVATLESAKQAVLDKKPYEIEIIISRKDGTDAWVFISNNPLFNQEGEVERQVGIIVDISERKKADEQITLLSLVASKTVNGVVINDDKGCVKWVNESFTKITGYGLQDVAGKRIGDVVKGPDTDIHELERVRTLSRESKPFNAELLNYKKDGTPIWVSVSNTPIFDQYGAVEQEIEIVNDISERKLAEQELIKTREEALALSRAKEMFVSVMSHEIRTPLNAVIGMTHILMEDNPTASQLEHLDILKFSAENLLSLLNAILDFTKIETGNLQLESVNVNLHDLVTRTMDSFRFKAKEKGIALHAEIDHRIPDLVRGDQTRLYQVLINLIGNSLKFTHEGEVRLRLILVSEDQESVSIRFEVSDTGIGIAKDKIDYIFEAYTQEKSDTARNYGGTGLGLAITRRLIELFGSRISVLSEEGKGSDFIFTISFQRAIEVTQQNQEKSTFKTFSSDVLVVDDNDINRLLARKVLAKWGIEADVAENGRVAIEKIRAKHYDLVLMDIQMPEMDGFEAVRRIRMLEDKYYRELPIIALTASVLSSDLQDILLAGMNDYVQKPFAPTDLYQKIEKYLGE
nr:PAS domain-containing hybrid sensor histidine kinase/response regulator [Hufsiella ginkgonis]